MKTIRIIPHMFFMLYHPISSYLYLCAVFDVSQSPVDKAKNIEDEAGFQQMNVRKLIR